MNVVGAKLVSDSGGYYTICEEIEYELKFGDLITELSGVDILSLKKVLLSCPYFEDAIPSEWEGYSNLCDWMQSALHNDEMMVIYRIIFFEIFNFIRSAFEYGADYNDSDSDDFFEAGIKKHIFENTDFNDYGDSNIGHLLLTALCGVAASVAIARKALKNICDGRLDIIQDSISQDMWDSTYIHCQFAFLFGEIRTIYTITDLGSVIFLELSKMCENRIIIKKCQNCGKYFVPASRSDEIYCGRVSPQDPGMTCKMYGSKRLWYDKLKEDDASKLSRNIYMAKQMLAKRNPDRPEYKEMLEFFKSERKKWKEQLKEGKKTVEEYTDWLKKMKAQKSLHRDDKPREKV